jgi:CDP-paratose 2-epimerase
MSLHADGSGVGSAVKSARPVLVTGGAGFIGAHLADHLAGGGTPVIVYDNLSRPQVAANLDWLRQRHGALVQHARDDVRDAAALRAAVRGVAHVFHCAAQVAVTTSLDAPAEDFEINARGTLNLLEAVRAEPTPPSLVYTSTNKVYGALGDVALSEGESRVDPSDVRLATRGVGEARPLDFHSPYGCSKGAADAYVIDYARSFGLRALVFRMSCIYGPRQLGSEDQGWVAHFWRCALERRPLTIYGDGKQVRDILFVDDLVEALMLARERAATFAGRAFNIGGGPDNTLSLRELLGRIESAVGRMPPLSHAPARIGDQRYYVSDTRAFTEATGWRPRVGVSEGLGRLGGWLAEAQR